MRSNMPNFTRAGHRSNDRLFTGENEGIGQVRSIFITSRVIFIRKFGQGGRKVCVRAFFVILGARKWSILLDAVFQNSAKTVEMTTLR